MDRPGITSPDAAKMTRYRSLDARTEVAVSGWYVGKRASDYQSILSKISRNRAPRFGFTISTNEILPRR